MLGDRILNPRAVDLTRATIQTVKRQGLVLISRTNAMAIVADGAPLTGGVGESR